MQSSTAKQGKPKSKLKWIVGVIATFGIGKYLLIAMFGGLIIILALTSALVLKFTSPESLASKQSGTVVQGVYGELGAKYSNYAKQAGITPGYLIAIHMIERDGATSYNSEINGCGATGPFQFTLSTWTGAWSSSARAAFGISSDGNRLNGDWSKICSAEAATRGEAKDAVSSPESRKYDPRDLDDAMCASAIKLAGSLNVRGENHTDTEKMLFSAMAYQGSTYYMRSFSSQLDRFIQYVEARYGRLDNWPMPRDENGKTHEADLKKVFADLQQESGVNMHCFDGGGDNNFCYGFRAINYARYYNENFNKLYGSPDLKGKLPWPIADAKGIPITSGFGLRTLPDGRLDFHPAIDIACKSGTSALAVVDGTVISSKFESDEPSNIYSFTNAGGTIVIKDANNFLYVYSHIRNRIAQEGDVVKVGQVLGETGGGASDPYHGFSTGAHLHFGIFKDGLRDNAHAVNPIDYLSPR